MGGTGSGRTSGHPTAEAVGSFVLTMKGFVRGLPWDAVGSGTLAFRDPWGAARSVVSIVAVTASLAPHVELAHATRTRPARRITYRIPLVVTVPRFGGLRWWFVCRPTYGRLCAKLEPVQEDGEAIFAAEAMRSAKMIVAEHPGLA